MSDQFTLQEQRWLDRMAARIAEIAYDGGVAVTRDTLMGLLKQAMTQEEALILELLDGRTERVRDARERMLMRTYRLLRMGEGLEVLDAEARAKEDQGGLDG